MGTHLIHHKQTTVLDSTYIHTNRLAMPQSLKHYSKTSSVVECDQVHKYFILCQRNLEKC